MPNKLSLKLSLVIVSLVMLLGIATSTVPNVQASQDKTEEIARSKQLDKDTQKLLKSNKPLQLDAKSALAIDYKTGQLLYAKNINKALPVASMSKLLTLYVTLHMIHNGQAHWNDKVKINRDLHKLSVDKDYANVKLKLGHYYTIRQLYQAAVYSENAAAMALGYGLAHGSTQKFALMMRHQARDLGIKDATIYTACGLTNGEVGALGFKDAPYDAENKLSARDMALLAMKILQLYPDILKSTSANTTKFEKTTMLNWNWMIKGRSQELPDIMVDGLKTGTSDTAKACFTGTAVKHGRRIITVVMGVPNTGQYDPNRFIQTRKLMKYVFAKYHYFALPKGAYLNGITNGFNNGMINVADGKRKHVDLSIAKNNNVWLTKKQMFNIVDVQPTKYYRGNHGVEAPFTDNDVIATGKVMGISYLPGVNNTVSLKSNQNVKSINFFARIWHKILNLF